MNLLKINFADKEKFVGVEYLETIGDFKDAIECVFGNQMGLEIRTHELDDCEVLWSCTLDQEVAYKYEDCTVSFVNGHVEFLTGKLEII